jgi:DTW domain-containing protein YfiP
VTVLILQHPREQRTLLNSARLCSMVLTNSVLRVGLSWPNLPRALGRATDPKRWAVLYLGRGPESEDLLSLTDRKGRPVASIEGLEGIVVLDASWRQSRTLWWRNPWITKLARIRLNPSHRSVRRQSKTAGLTTAEAVGLTLEALEPGRGIGEALEGQFMKLIAEPNRRTGSRPAGGGRDWDGKGSRYDRRRGRPRRRKRPPEPRDA